MSNNPKVIPEYFDSIGKIYSVVADIVFFFFLISFKLHQFPSTVLSLVHINVEINASIKKVAPLRERLLKK